MGLKLKWYKRPAHNGEIISSNLIRPTNLGEQNAPFKTNILPTRLGIFRFLYGERVSEVWEGKTNLKLRCAYNTISYGFLRNQIG